MKIVSVVAGLPLLLLMLASYPLDAQTAAEPKGPPTVAEAKAFMDDAEARLDKIGIRANKAAWVQQTYITEDTENLSAAAQAELTAAVTDFALKARRFDGLQMPDELARKFKLLKLALVAPAPNNDKDREELANISAGLESAYGRGTYCRQKAGKQECLQINALSKIMANSRDPQELLDVWQGWHKIAPPMKQRYARFVELSNAGAKELGFPDTGAMWRSNYDMPPEQFAAELDRLWKQVEPLYLSLHAYVRTQLAKKYGEQVVPKDGMIPAHLLGNMWAQEWGNIYPVVAPANASQGYDLTAELTKRNTDELKMVHYGEDFFKSLGFAPLPQTFWERSLFKKPADRDVVCHASAWDVDNKEDLRLKMCIEITSEDFVVIHHELGHNFYQRAYMHQPSSFQDSANDGFHEAIGDTMALSTTPEYLKQIGLIDTVPGPENDIGYLLKQALDKVAFLPFGLLIDKWRWKVFSGEVTPADYNRAWWELRNHYQGVSAPLPRSEADFDPGAKYHVPANTPYARYFLARILQFQFHRALCHEAGFTGPLHRCSIYNNKKAGAKLAKMLEMGKSRPWPEELQALSGETQMDATAILDYFAPLKKWLDEQNQAAGAQLGWDADSRAAAGSVQPVATKKPGKKK